MSVRPIELAVDLCARLDVDAYVIFVHDDERPLWGLGGLLDWRLAGGLSRMLAASLLGTAAGDRTLASPEGACIFVVGLGAAELDDARFEARAREAAHAVEKAGWSSVAVGVPEMLPSEASTVILTRCFAGLKGNVTIVTATGHVVAPAPATTVSLAPANRGAAEPSWGGKSRKGGKRK